MLVSGLAEDEHPEEAPAEMAGRLALGKAQTVADRLAAADSAGPTLVLGCDSVLELDGRAFGKPGDAEDATRRWRVMRGRWAQLHTGHAVVFLPGRHVVHRVASTAVQFADISDEEVAAYVATGEPLSVAGAFTIDGLGGAFVERIEGDPHNVVGVSLPLLRDLLRQLDVSWPTLWATATVTPAAPRDASAASTGPSSGPPRTGR